MLYEFRVEEEDIENIINNNLKGYIKEMIISKVMIAKEINNKLVRAYEEDLFNKVVKVYIKYIIVHELVHVKQIKEKTLTKAVIKQLKDIPDSKKEYEIEAHMKAKELIEKDDKLSRQIVNMIYENKKIDFDKLNE